MIATGLMVLEKAGHVDLDALGAEFLVVDRPFLGVSRSDCVGLVDRWLRDRELA